MASEYDDIDLDGMDHDVGDGDWDKMFEEPEPRTPPSSKREAVVYALTDVKDGVKEGFSKENLSTNIKSLAKGFKPKALTNEARQIGNVKDAIAKEGEELLKRNKSSINNISNFVKGKTREGGFLHGFASRISDKTSDEDTNNSFNVEEQAREAIDNILSETELQDKSEELKIISSYRQEEATNRIYNTLLKQEAFTKSITSMYYRKSLEFQYIHLATSRQSLGVMRDGFIKLENVLSYVVKNTALPDVIKMRSTEAITAQARNTLVNDKVTKLFKEGGWVSGATQKIKNKLGGVDEAISGVSDTIESAKMASEMSENMAEMTGDSKTKMASQSIPGLAMGFIGSQASKVFGNTRVGRKTMDFGKGLASDPASILRDASDSIGGSDNIYMNYLKKKTAKGLGGIANILDTEDSRKTIKGLSTTDLTESTTLDKKALITQNEIIPGLLAKILKEVTLIRTKGKESDVEETKFDFETRSFTTVKEQSTKLSGRLKNLTGNTSMAKDVTGLAKFILNASGIPYDPLMLSEVKTGLTSYMLSGSTFSPSKLDSKFYSMFNSKTQYIVSAGIARLVSSKNPDRGANLSKLKSAYNNARDSIPNVENVINRQIELGNTDLLVKNNLLDMNVKTGKYSINEKEHNKRILDTVKEYQGEGTEVTPDVYEREDTIFDDFVRAKKKSRDFKSRVDKNLSPNEYGRTQSNRPTTGSMFTINKSGTNSLTEKLSSDLTNKTKSVGSDLGKKINEYGEKIKNTDQYTTTMNTIEDYSNKVQESSQFKKAKDVTTETIDKVKNLKTSKTMMDIESTYDGMVSKVKGMNAKEAEKIIREATNKVLSKLNLDTLEGIKLSIKDNMIIAGIMDSISNPEEMKASVVAYLAKEGKITEDKLREILTSNNLKNLKTNIKDDITSSVTAKTNTLDSIGNVKDSISFPKRPSLESIKETVIGTVKLNKDKLSIMLNTNAQVEAVKDSKQAISDTLDSTTSKEDVIKHKEKEDKRIETIITKVLKNLNLGKAKTKANDRDSNGIRDGSWMDRWKNKKTPVSGGIKKVATAAKAVGKKSKLAMILSVLGFGVGIIGKYLFGVVKGVGSFLKLMKWLGGGIFKVVRGIGSLASGITGLLGTVIKGIFGLGGKIVRGVGKGLKWVGSRVFKLGTRIVTGMGSLLGKLGKSIISGVGKSLSGLKNVFSKGFSGLKDTVLKGASKAKDIVKGLGSKLGGVVKSAGSTIAKAGTKTAVKTAAKTAAKFIPGVGLALGAGLAVKELADGNYAKAAAELFSGLLTTIPGVGGALSMGVDALSYKYLGSEVKVDTNLYNGGSFPSVSMDSMDKITLEHIRKEETGSAEGKYGTAGDIGDGAGVSYGAYQFTEKSGNLKKYVERIVKLTNDPVGQQILDKFKGNMYGGNKAELIDYLKKTGVTDAGKSVQDGMFKEMFLDPAKKLAASYNITDPAAISQVIDHGVNAGLGGAKRMLGRAGGKVTPQDIANARKMDYNAIASSNPSKQKYMKTWTRRVDNNAKAFMNHKPGENDPKIGAENTLVGQLGITPPGTTPPVVNNTPPVVTPPGTTPPVVANTPPVVETKAPTLNPVNTLASQLANTEQTTTPPVVTNTPPVVAPKTVVAPVVSQMDSYAPTQQVQATVSAPSPVINMGGLESLVADSNKHLQGINGNTTNMVSRQVQMISALEEIKKLLGSKQTSTTSSNTNSNSKTIETPMPNGVNIKKGASVK